MSNGNPLARRFYGLTPLSREMIAASKRRKEKELQRKEKLAAGPPSADGTDGTP